MVKKSLHLVSTVISPLLALCLAAGDVSAEETEDFAADRLELAPPVSEDLVVDVPAEPDPQLLLDPLPVPEYDRQVELLEQKGGALGYSIFASDGHAGRALEYGFLKSSPSGGLFYRRMEKDTNVELDGFFKNENDYYGDLLVDYRGDYRLHLRTESLYHNLDRELLFTDPFSFARNDPPAPGDTAYDPLAPYLPVQDPAADYGVSVVQERADFRYRLHNYPMHVNLGYWRYLREGTVQQRFADMSFEGPENVIRAKARGVDQSIQEGRLGLDAHLGPVDVIYDFKYRRFKDHLPAPTASFVARNDINGNPEVAGGIQPHNDNPDSRFLSHTLKLHTSIAGGLVAGASYSIEQRENLSQLASVTGARHAKAYLQNAAGDFIYTPRPDYSFSLKYRRQELDHGHRNPVFSTNFVDPAQVVKFPVETTKDLIVGTLAYKPRLDLSLIGEYRGEFLERSNVSEFPSPTTWALPERSATRTGSVALHYRPVKGVRTSAHFKYATTDHPAYGTSFTQRREGKLLATYNRSSTWGVTAQALLRHDKNDEVERFLLDFPFQPLSYTAYPLLATDRRSENSNIGAWFTPVPKLVLGASYAYLRVKVNQPVLFTTILAGSEAPALFTSRSHVYGVNASYAASEKLDLSLMLQQVRSDSALRPEQTTFAVLPGSTSAVRGISETDSVQSSLSARGEYRFNSVLSSSLQYAVSDYDEKNATQSAYNGAAHTFLAMLAAKW